MTESSAIKLAPLHIQRRRDMPIFRRLGIWGRGANKSVLLPRKRTGRVLFRTNRSHLFTGDFGYCLNFRLVSGRACREVFCASPNGTQSSHSQVHVPSAHGRANCTTKIHHYNSTALPNVPHAAPRMATSCWAGCNAPSICFKREQHHLTCVFHVQDNEPHAPATFVDALRPPVDRAWTTVPRNVAVQALKYQVVAVEATWRHGRRGYFYVIITITVRYGDDDPPPTDPSIQKAARNSPDWWIDFHSLDYFEPIHL